jgi:hypothetical protein
MLCRAAPSCSPRYLERRGKVEEARAAFAKLTSEVAPRNVEVLVAAASFERRQGDKQVGCCCCCCCCCCCIAPAAVLRLLHLLLVVSFCSRYQPAAPAGTSSASATSASPQAACALFESLLGEERSRDSFKAYAFLAAQYALLLRQAYGDLDKARQVGGAVRGVALVR